MKKQLTVTALLVCLWVAAFAQGAEVCTGSAYTIANTVAATTGSTFRWTENGNIISGATAATYTIPSSKAAGVYTYVRQSKSAECDDWQSSNEFTATVYTCSVTVGGTGSTATYVDPRDGQSYKIVRMPDNKIWFAQNLNYTKGLYYNARVDQANGTLFTTVGSGVPAIGSYWCPAANGSVASGGQSMCAIYGALYTWETAMMVDGKYADEAKTSSAWVEPSSSNYFTSGAPATTPGAKVNNARGTVVANGGGRGICPAGWRVPTDYEWAYMLDKVEGNTTYTVSQTGIGWWGGTAGVKLRTTATYSPTDLGNGSWLDYSTTRGSNTTGFGAEAAGIRYSDGSVLFDRGIRGDFWSSSVYDGFWSWYRYLHYAQNNASRTPQARSYGYSVRCVRD